MVSRFIDRFAGVWTRRFSIWSMIRTHHRSLPAPAIGCRADRIGWLISIFHRGNSSGCFRTFHLIRWKSGEDQRSTFPPLVGRNKKK
jgi:hypothetical protein